MTNQSNFVLGARSFPGNLYDGHTLHSCMEQAEILSGTKAEEAFVDLGYRGVEVAGVVIYKARQKPWYQYSAPQTDAETSYVSR